MVGKTFKGLTDALLTWQTERFLELEERRDGHRRVRATGAGRGDRPRRRHILSPRYPGGVALRFARVVRYRSDEDQADADTIQMVQALLPGAGSLPDFDDDVDAGGPAVDEG